MASKSITSSTKRIPFLKINFESFLLQLETISLVDIPAQFVKPILKVFGAGLKRLTLKSCEDINVPDLIYCKQLEALQILGFCCLAEKRQMII